MKIIFTADLHIKLKHDLRYKKDLIKFIDYFLNILVKEKPDYVFIAGDVFDTKLPTPAELTLATAFIKRIIDYNINLVIIPGNHDTPAYEFGYNTLHPLENLQLKNLHILNNINIYNLGSIDILAVPYTYLRKEEALNKVAELHNKYIGNNLFLLGHFWVDGYSSIEPSKNEFVFTKDFLNKLYKVKMGIVGHIHYGGMITDKFLYCGSPFRITIAENEEFKYIYKFEDNTLYKIVCPAFPIVKINIRNPIQNLEIKDSICVIEAKDITIDQLHDINELKKNLEKNGNYVYLDLELKKINFTSIADSKDISIKDFLNDYIKKNDLISYRESIISICEKIIKENITDNTSVYDIEEFGWNK